MSKKSDTSALFNEYGAASEKLSDLCFELEGLVKEFWKTHNITEPIDLRASAHYIDLWLHGLVEERVLRYGSEKRKENRRK